MAGLTTATVQLCGNTGRRRDGEGPVDYVSDRDGGASMTVELSGSHEAVIFVECNVYAQINNHGRAIIDMQSGSGFYFLVPWVAVGNYHCHNPWFYFEAIPVGKGSSS